MPRRFLFGLVEVPMWGYRCGHTIAQIELMSVDVPFVAYKARKDKPKPGQSGRTATKDYADRQYANWLARKKAEQEKGINISLGTFVPYQPQETKIDMNTFLQTGEERPAK